MKATANSQLSATDDNWNVLVELCGLAIGLLGVCVLGAAVLMAGFWVIGTFEPHPRATPEPTDLRVPLSGIFYFGGIALAALVISVALPVLTRRNPPPVSAEPSDVEDRDS